MNKDVLRKVYLEKRLTLTTSEREKRNKALISTALSKIDFENHTFIHVFLSIAEKGEVDTYRLIDEILKAHSHVKIVVPKVTGKRKLTHFLYSGKKQLEISKWDIPEPKEGKIISSGQIDLVFIPLISFDRQGNRIGYGGGFYDTFLQDCRSNILKVGLSLSSPLDKIPYIDKHDIPMDSVIYPGGYMKFK